MIIDKINAPVTAPEYSHSKERIYVIIQKDKIKHVAFYDENHIQ